MRPLTKYHHFREELIDPNDRVAKCEQHVVDLLLHSDLPNSKRESSVYWELKHQASTLQFARILALKRGLPVDICAAGLMFHDIYVIVHGQYQDHARLGTPIATKILKAIGGFSDEELDQISRIIQNHSDKHVWTDDPFQEIGKDVDVLDCFLYEGAFDQYLGSKPLSIFKEYLKRAKKVWGELQLPVDPRFDLLDDYKEPWFQHIRTMPYDLTRGILAILLEISTAEIELGLHVPPFSILLRGERGEFYANYEKWAEHVAKMGTQMERLVRSRALEVNVSILTQFLKDPSFDTLRNVQSLVQEKAISKESLEQATDILLSNRPKEGVENYALLFWPVLQIYEPLNREKINKRFQELGLEMSSH